MPALDKLQIYLVVVNVFSFVLGALTFRSVRRISTFAQSALSAMGGSVGILAAALLWDRKTNKENVAARFLALGAGVVWALVLWCVYGGQRLSVEGLQASLGRDHTPLLAYMGVVCATTFVAFCLDKHKATRGSSRIPEAVLLGLCFIGGTLGGLLGMLVAHHKVRSAHFTVGLPLMLVLQVVVLAFLLQNGWV